VLSPNEVIDGRYRIVRPLGHGGMGVTYEAEAVVSGARVAIKMLALDRVNDGKVVELFEREAEALENLHHPAIPTFIEHFAVQYAGARTSYLVQQLAPGWSLAQWVASGWRADEAEVRRIAEAVLGVLGYLHARMPPLIHRDVKPENIVREESGKIWLVDFGAVRTASESATLGGSTVVGTYGYMAPEQLRGLASPASDVYGLGATLVFLLTGRPPSELPQKKLAIDFRPRAHASTELLDLVEHMVAPAPEDRLLNANQALSELKAPKRAARRGSGRVIALSATLVAVLGLAGAVYLYEQPTRGPRHALSSTAASTPALALPERPSNGGSFDAVPRYAFTIPAHFSAVMSVAFTNDSSQILSASWDDTVKLWDAHSGKAIRAFAGHTGRVGGVRPMPDGKRIVSGGDTTVRIWDLATGKGLQTIQADDTQIFAVDVTRDGKTIASCGTRGNVKLWSGDTGAPIATLAHGDKRVLGAAFSPDGTRLVTGGEDSTVKLWDVASHALLATMTAHSKVVNAVAFSPDGQTVASASDDRTIVLSQPANGHAFPPLLLDDDEAWSVAFSPDGGSLIAGGKGRKLATWDVQRAKLRDNADIGAAAIGTLSVAFSPDGALVATSHGEGDIFVWKMPATTTAVIPAAHVVARPPLSGSRDARLCAEGTDLVEEHAYAAGALDLAEKKFRAALDLDPRSVGGLVGLARVATRRANRGGDAFDAAGLASARTFANQALAIAPESAAALVESAWVASFQRDEARLQAETAHAVRVAPTSSYVLAVAAQADFDAKNDVAAERDEMQILAQPISRWAVINAYEMLIKIYWRRSDPRAIDELYRRLVDIEPDAAWPKGNYAGFLVSRGDYDAAIAWAQKAIAQASYGAAHETLAIAWSRKGDTLLWDSGDAASAKQAYETALLAYPASSPAYYGLGACDRWMAAKYRDSSKLADAQTAFERAEKLDPKNLEAQKAVAEGPAVAQRLGF
jgi:tetratricopeptide (TPR) repeat protein